MRPCGRDSYASSLAMSSSAALRSAAVFFTLARVGDEASHLFAAATSSLLAASAAFWFRSEKVLAFRCY
jgi:hypothetical protein